jgi:hypothetical protein
VFSDPAKLSENTSRVTSNGVDDLVNLEESASVVPTPDTGTTILSFGSFYLRHIPMDVFMARPTDNEFSENKARALWKLALNFAIGAVRSRTLWWHVLRERRDKRRRFIRIVLIQLSNDEITSVEDDNEYTALVRTTHPDDLALWRFIASLNSSRRIYRCVPSSWIIFYT